MNYKEKYIALVNKIHKAHLYAQTDSTRAVLEEIRPELREVGDEEVRKAMIDFFKHEREEVKDGIAVLHYGVNVERMIAYLEKRGEQKPAEWSEEDSYMSGQAIKCVNNSGKLDVSTEEIEDWLKSLKGRIGCEANCTTMWKPSGEQMNSILCAVKKMKESACYDSELVSLYNDLKKLKG